MTILKYFALISVSLAVEIYAANSHRKSMGWQEPTLYKEKQHAKKFFRLLGGHKLKDKNHIPSLEEDFDYTTGLNHNDETDSFYTEGSYLGESKDDIAQDFLQKSPQFKLLANNKVIFEESLDLAEKKQWNLNFGNDVSSTRNKQQEAGDSSNWKHTHHHQKHRNARSVSMKSKGPLISSFRRINRDPEDVSVDGPSDNDTTKFGEDTKAENSIAASPTTSNQNGLTKPNLATVTESVSTPSNGGVTKVEINLSFGCLFFCE